MNQPLLKLEQIDTFYGQVQVHFGVSLDVPRGEIVSLLGGNASGKSTAMKIILGLHRPRSGTITFDGEVINGLLTPQIVRRGIASVPEARRLFGDMTVRENLLMGAYLAPRDAGDRMREVLAVFPRLAERARQLAATLSGGEQQMLAIGRALMRKPVLLVLDEPSLGLSPVLVQVIYRAIGDLRRAGMTILLAEQSAHIALRLADRACVLETGRIVVEGAAGALLNDQRVREAYLGGV
jgi:branched-chain amino acid transport system ATP-binding protein